MPVRQPRESLCIGIFCPSIGVILSGGACDSSGVPAAAGPHLRQATRRRRCAAAPRARRSPPWTPNPRAPPGPLLGRSAAWGQHQCARCDLAAQQLQAMQVGDLRGSARAGAVLLAKWGITRTTAQRGPFWITYCCLANKKAAPQRMASSVCKAPLSACITRAKSAHHAVLSEEER